MCEAAIATLNVPLPPVDLARHYDFERRQLGGVWFAVDGEAAERIGAASRLSVEDTSAVPRLIAMLGQDRTTPAAAQLAGTDLREATTTESQRVENLGRFTEADLACQLAAQQALVRIGAAAIPLLMSALSADSERRRLGALKSLAQMGPAAESAMPTLRHVEKRDRSPLVRQKTSEAIEKIKPNRW